MHKKGFIAFTSLSRGVQLTDLYLRLNLRIQLQIKRIKIANEL